MEPQERPPVWEEEALVPELVDRVEYQDAELARLRSDLAALREEREKLETDLVIAERWVHTLAKELELADAQLKELRPLSSRIGTPLRPPSRRSASEASRRSYAPDPPGLKPRARARPFAAEPESSSHLHRHRGRPARPRPQ